MRRIPVCSTSGAARIGRATPATCEGLEAFRAIREPFLPSLVEPRCRSHMLFNSLPFILAFLPATPPTHGLLARKRRSAAQFPAGGFALVLRYRAWRFEPLLVGSIVVNWLVARATSAGARIVLVAAIVVNLMWLAVFKYLGFLGGVVEETID